MRYWMWGVRTGKVRGHMTLGLDTDGSGSGFRVFGTTLRCLRLRRSLLCGIGCGQKENI